VSIKPDLRSYSRVSYLREIHGDVPGAIEALTMAVGAGAPGADNTSWCMVTLGNLYMEYGQLEEAEKVFLSALEARPDYPFALEGLAAVEIERKDYKIAEQHLERAKAIIPEVGFYENLAVIYKATGRDAEYKRTIDEVIEMMNDDATHGHNMDLEFANVYHSLFNDLDTAIKFALKEYAARPDNIDVNGVLATIYAAKGDIKKAEEHRVKALRTGSKKPELLALNN
jgi:tetratricopeptide (TPR) repeat protein